MLPRTYTAEDEIPEGVRDHYEEKDGAFELQVDMAGFVPAIKLREFRDRNIKLTATLEPWEALGADVTPESVAEALSIKKGLEGKELIVAGKSDELIAAATAEMRSAHDQALGELTQERDQSRGLLKDLTIRGEILTAGHAIGLVKTAEEDLVRRGLEIFDIDKGGKVVAIGEDGKGEYGPDGEPLTPKEWVELLPKKAGHLFEPSVGGGSPGSGPVSGDAEFNRWKAANPYDPVGTKHHNLTKQGKLEKNPQTRGLAKKLADIHGLDISERLSLLNVRNQGQPQTA